MPMHEVLRVYTQYHGMTSYQMDGYTMSLIIFVVCLAAWLRSS